MIKPSELNEKYKIGGVITLQGFTSSTFSKESALSFAFDDKSIVSDETVMKALLIEFEFHGKQQFFYLNSEIYSAFPEEDEVLL